jgi:xanthine dehydrogenase molybdopterin-binding subunit B
VRYVGEPIAIVVAETALQAQDAVDAIGIDYDLPAVIGPAGGCTRPRCLPDAHDIQQLLRSRSMPAIVRRPKRRSSEPTTSLA